MAYQRGNIKGGDKAMSFTQFIYWCIAWYVFYSTHLKFWQALLWPYYAINGVIW